MKYILEIKNYDTNILYVDTDQKKYALDSHSFPKEGFASSNVYQFQKTFWDSSVSVPSLLLQRKTDFYNFVESLKENGYQEVEFAPVQSSTKDKNEELNDDVER